MKIRYFICNTIYILGKSYFEWGTDSSVYNVHSASSPSLADQKWIGILDSFFQNWIYIYNNIILVYQIAY